MRFWYSALMYTLLPLILLRMLVRSLRAPAYRQRWAERFGVFEAIIDSASPTLWIHAVSLGEVQAVAPLINSLQASYPGHRLVVTTTTPTGSARVSELFGNTVFHVYLPFDLPGSVARFLDRVRPGILLLVETELWPNLAAACEQRECRQMLVNARLSERSAARYRFSGSLIRGILARLDGVACQTEADRERFLSLGLDPRVCEVTGSLKFDVVSAASLSGAGLILSEALLADQRTIIAAASTHEGEEEAVLSAFAYVRERIPNCLLLLAPRHPERFERVHGLCEAGGWNTERRSTGSVPTALTEVLLLDSLGELAQFYPCASLAFIGGSLVRRGGHNPLEAAACSVPAVSGPYIENFAEIYRLLEDAQGVQILGEGQALGPALTALIQQPVLLRAMGKAGERIVATNRGACEATLGLIARELMTT